MKLDDSKWTMQQLIAYVGEHRPYECKAYSDGSGRTQVGNCVVLGESVVHVFGEGVDGRDDYALSGGASEARTRELRAYLFEQAQQIARAAVMRTLVEQELERARSRAPK